MTGYALHSLQFVAERGNERFARRTGTESAASAPRIGSAPTHQARNVHARSADAGESRKQRASRIPSCTTNGRVATLTFQDRRARSVSRRTGRDMQTSTHTLKNHSTAAQAHAHLHADTDTNAEVSGR